MTAPEQLVLQLPLRAALGRDDFLVGESNAAAVKLIDDWPNWPSHVTCLVGADGSGKSHLVSVWQMKASARVVSLHDINVEKIPTLLETGALCLEHHQGHIFDEHAVFHAFNIARQSNGYILFTSRLAPSAWQVKLPDLASRLKAVPVVDIAPPDDAILRGVLVKLFSDRQINVDEPLVDYMLSRMPRSLAAARQLVAEIDRLAMVEKAEITRPFVGRVLAGFENLDLFSP